MVLMNTREVKNEPREPVVSEREPVAAPGGGVSIQFRPSMFQFSDKQIADYLAEQESAADRSKDDEDPMPNLDSFNEIEDSSAEPGEDPLDDPLADTPEVRPVEAINDAADETTDFTFLKALSPDKENCFPNFGEVNGEKKKFTITQTNLSSLPFEVIGQRPAKKVKLSNGKTVHIFVKNSKLETKDGSSPEQQNKELISKIIDSINLNEKFGMDYPKSPEANGLGQTSNDSGFSDDFLLDPDDFPMVENESKESKVEQYQNFCTKKEIELKENFACKKLLAPQQLSVLEKEFEMNNFITEDRGSLISTAIGLTEEQVKSWFIARRTKQKELMQNITKEDSERSKMEPTENFSEALRKVSYGFPDAFS